MTVFFLWDLVHELNSSNSTVLSGLDMLFLTFCAKFLISFHHGSYLSLFYQNKLTLGEKLRLLSAPYMRKMKG
jgi:hypothetical protein